MVIIQTLSLYVIYNNSEAIRQNYLRFWLFIHLPERHFASFASNAISPVLPEW
jgi:hypothetical protein